MSRMRLAISCGMLAILGLWCVVPGTEGLFMGRTSNCLPWSDLCGSPREAYEGVVARSVGLNWLGDATFFVGNAGLMGWLHRDR